MWISKQLAADSSQEPNIQIGSVTISSPENLSVSGMYEKRKIDLYFPYGIESLPPVGSKSILLNCDGKYVCIASHSNISELEPGELRLSSSGGAYIYLKNNGQVIINGIPFPFE